MGGGLASGAAESGVRGGGSGAGGGSKGVGGGVEGNGGGGEGEASSGGDDGAGGGSTGAVGGCVGGACGGGAGAGTGGRAGGGVEFVEGAIGMCDATGDATGDTGCGSDRPRGDGGCAPVELCTRSPVATSSAKRSLMGSCGESGSGGGAVGGRCAWPGLGGGDGGTVGGGGGGGGGGGESDLAPKCRAIWTNCCITGDQVSPIVGPSPARRRGSAHAVRGAPGIRPAVATWLRHGYASAARVLLAGPVPRNLT